MLLSLMDYVENVQLNREMEICCSIYLIIYLFIF